MRAFILLLVLGVTGPAQAMSLCGAMTIPPSELRQVARGFSGGHTGIDLMAPAGSPARAASGGVIVYAGWYYAYGQMIDIQHADSLITRYAHLSAFAPGIAPGKAVSAGQVIGQVGATGRAHGPHVHFEVRANGRAVDPKPYLALAACPGTIEQDSVLEALAPPETARRKR